MANKQIFRSQSGRQIPETNHVNRAGGAAYKFDAKLGLANLAATGCIGNTFYAHATDQLDDVLQLCAQNEPEFIGKVALYARESAFMKDMPALLCAHLSTRGEEGRAVLRRIFPRVVDNVKMLRNFVQILRSGKTGRKSLGTFPKRLVQEFLLSKDPDRLFRESVGQSPSMADVIKMVHPKPNDPVQQAFFGYLIGQEAEDKRFLPPLVQEFEYWKQDPRNREIPKIPVEMVTAYPLSTWQWKQLARNGGWHFTRMNLNTFARHGILDDSDLVSTLAAKLQNRELILKSRVFPYQTMVAYMNATDKIPRPLKVALHSALEIATQNVPSFPGRVIVFPDVSGSMNSPITGRRKGATSKVTCSDVAALFASTILRKNPDAMVVPVDTRAHPEVRLEPLDTIMTE